MLAKNLVRQIIKRGGTAEIRDRELSNSVCVHCGTTIRRHNVLNMAEPDYIAWLPTFALDDSVKCKHEPVPSFEVVGELGGYDVHAYGTNFSHYTTRSIAKRGHHDPFSDYNPGGWTCCNRLADLDWACR
jgi:hypothetical protein